MTRWIVGIALLIIVVIVVPTVKLPHKTSDYRRCAAQALAFPQSAARNNNDNLVVNGNAEATVGSPDDSHIVEPSAWKTFGNFTVVQYGANPGDFPDDDHAPVDHGRNFFAGGPSAPFSCAVQIVRLPPAAKHYMLSAALGGWRAQDDYAAIFIRFLDRDNAEACGQTRGPTCPELTPPPIGPPTENYVMAFQHLFRSVPPDTMPNRNNDTGFCAVSSSGAIPPSADKAAIVIETFRFNGDYNDGYIDNVAFRASANRSTATPKPQCWHGQSQD